MTPDEMIKMLHAAHPMHLGKVDLYKVATMIETLQNDCRKWKKMAEDLIRLHEISQRREERMERLGISEEPTCEEEKSHLLRAIEPLNEFDSAIAGAQTYEALVKDAERHRFLRAQHEDPNGGFSVIAFLSTPVEDLDAAIDAAMEKS